MSMYKCPLTHATTILLCILCNFKFADNLYYPSWLSGTWDVTQTLIAASTPLGLKFIGGPNGSEAIAAESFKEQTKQMNVPVKLQLRFVTTKFGVAEDRIFNTRERLDGFAGRKVVSSIEYCKLQTIENTCSTSVIVVLCISVPVPREHVMFTRCVHVSHTYVSFLPSFFCYWVFILANVGGSNRQSVLALGGSEDTPLQTTCTFNFIVQYTYGTSLFGMVCILYSSVRIICSQTNFASVIHCLPFTKRYTT